DHETELAERFVRYFNIFHRLSLSVQKKCNYSGVQTEGYNLSRKARIKPFKTFSVSTTVGSSRDKSSSGK
ncbi:MAG: hypothetical protein K2X00_19795, partial [Nitrospiraceae bacterium]|nr:hypothetical protein [Nitrospiraceae bacterium]